MNAYMTKSLDNFLNISVEFKKSYNQFISELIHSSLLIAHDEEHKPIVFTIDGKDYGLVFTSPEEYEKTFPSGDESYLDFDLSAMKEIIKGFKLDGCILNISNQNFYLTKKILNNLDILPRDCICSDDSYSCDELKELKNSIDNEILEEFMKNPGTCRELFEIISSTVLFGLMESDKDMSILEYDGMIDTMFANDKYDWHIHNRHVALFTSENRLKGIKTSKFKYLALANFASIAHVAINRELEGIVINPGDEEYIIPVDTLIRNWSLIYRTCWDERLISAKYSLFSIEDI